MELNEDLLKPQIVAAFDREFFEREGYWVWEGVLTEEGRARWTTSLQNLQRMNDEIIVDTDWAAIDFKHRGLPSPDPDRVTPEFLAACCGGSEQMKFLQPGWRDYMHDHGLFGPGPELVTRGYSSQGLMPEYFPGAYDEFILDVTTEHPQMMELFQKVLGERFVIDHCLMLNRAPDSGGRKWHGHPYRDGSSEVEDPIGTEASLTREFLQEQCVRTLCYPEGADDTDGGDFAVIPGAHLYRIPFKWSTKRPDHDEDMRAGWLRGKIHAFTGKPLEIVRLSIPPGSMVSFVHHMPHHVGRRMPEAPVRWGLLMANRTPDCGAAPAQWSNGVPAHWAKRNAGRISEDARRVLAGDNPIDPLQ